MLELGDDFSDSLSVDRVELIITHFQDTELRASLQTGVDVVVTPVAF